MTTLQGLSLQDVFKIRDALAILESYGYPNESLKLQIYQMIESFRDGGDR